MVTITMIQKNDNNTMHNNNTTDYNNNSIEKNLPIKMTPKDNPVSKVKRNGSKTQSEAFANMLEWCRQASQLEHCPWLTGGNKYNGDIACTCLHALWPKLDREESPALQMVACWACYVACNSYRLACTQLPQLTFIRYHLRYYKTASLCIEDFVCWLSFYSNV
jgi:hypothetical protein